MNKVYCEFLFQRYRYCEIFSNKYGTCQKHFDHWVSECSEPVLPNPPSPREVSDKDSTSFTSGEA